MKYLRIFLAITAGLWAYSHLLPAFGQTLEGCRTVNGQRECWLWNFTVSNDLTVDGDLYCKNTTADIPASGTITEAMCQGAQLTDDSLTAATDVQLLDLEYETSFSFIVTAGTYGTSWVPPSGESIIYISTVLTANYELDLSSSVYDEFIFKRVYVSSAWYWLCRPVQGYGADGGAS